MDLAYGVRESSQGTKRRIEIKKGVESLCHVTRLLGRLFQGFELVYDLFLIEANHIR